MVRFQDFTRILGQQQISEGQDWACHNPQMDARKHGKDWIDNLLEGSTELPRSTHAHK